MHGNEGQVFATFTPAIKLHMHIKQETKNQVETLAVSVGKLHPHRVGLFNQTLEKIMNRSRRAMPYSVELNCAHQSRVSNETFTAIESFIVLKGSC
jgi:hypothetical protein